MEFGPVHKETFKDIREYAAKDKDYHPLLRCSNEELFHLYSTYSEQKMSASWLMYGDSILKDFCEWCVLPNYVYLLRSYGML